MAGWTVFSRLISFDRPVTGLAAVGLRVSIAAALFGLGFWLATLAEPRARAVSVRFWEISGQTLLLVANSGSSPAFLPALESLASYSLAGGPWEIQPFWISSNWKERLVVPLSFWMLVLCGSVWLVGPRAALPRRPFWSWLSIALVISGVFAPLFFPLVTVLIWLVPLFDAPTADGLIVSIMLAYVALTPAMVVRSAAGRSRRMPYSRWRPVCPECGHQLRGAAEPRCAECGMRFLSTGRSRRYWAIHRAPWDCKPRGLFLTAYVQTLALVFFRPCTAARRLSVPDRLGRAGRWAFGHILLGAIIPVAVALIWQIPSLNVSGSPAPGTPASRAFSSVRQLIEYDVESVVARCTWLAGILVVEILLVFAIPHIQRPTRRALIKWSCYACPVFVLANLLIVAARRLIVPVAIGSGSIPIVPDELEFIIPASPPAASILITCLVAMLFWALPAATIPGRIRWRWGAALVLAAGGVGAWLLVVDVIFPSAFLEHHL